MKNGKMQMSRQATTPLNVRRTMRSQRVRTLTSLPAGKMVPIAVSPLLREDQVKRGVLRLSFEMHETAEMLMNSINVDVKAYLVPFTALDRFEGIEDFNRSFEGAQDSSGNDPVDFFLTTPFGANGANEIFKYLGLHGGVTDMVNDVYIEAYNQIWNFRAKNRSPNLSERSRTNTTLAPAFWNHSFFKHIVPDFDQAKIDGEVALNVANARLPVSGLGITQDTTHTPSDVKESDGSTSDYGSSWWGGSPTNPLYIRESATNSGFPDVFAELQDNGITVSLANIDLAKKTQAFAKLRQQYAGHDEEYITDMLMDGLQVPNQHLRQPMLIAQGETIFGMSKRYATSSGALSETAVNGLTMLDMTVRTPRISTGGVVMIVAEITPEQLWERQQDPLLSVTRPVELPSYLRDELDPEKVSVVPNSFVDVLHTTPSDTFGYAPLNHQWNMDQPRVGGRFYRPAVNTVSDSDRQRIWAVETVDPTLSEDFYIVNNMHQKVFADETLDPFEVVANGQLLIEGNTVFGHALIEASEDYAKVSAEAPTETIDKT